MSIAESGAVGEHLGMEMVEERLATHYFTCTARAYLGWRWAVSVARVPRSKTVTVCEANLVPGEGALLSPDWVPYAERLAPGDVGPGDVTPLVADDPNLEPGFEATGDEDVDQVALWELGLGRPRVLSAEGREAAAQRWYEGESGPSAPGRGQGSGAVLHLRVLRADGRRAARGVRGVRQRVVALRRPGRQPRPRLRGALRGRRRLCLRPSASRRRSSTTSSSTRSERARLAVRLPRSGRLAALLRPRPTNHSAKTPSAMPATHVQGHHDRSPVCSDGTSSVTTRASAQMPMPTRMIVRVGTALGSTGADGPSTVECGSGRGSWVVTGPAYGAR